MWCFGVRLLCCTVVRVRALLCCAAYPGTVLVETASTTAYALQHVLQHDVALVVCFGVLLLCCSPCCAEYPDMVLEETTSTTAVYILYLVDRYTTYQVYCCTYRTTAAAVPCVSCLTLNRYCCNTTQRHRQSAHPVSVLILNTREILGTQAPITMWSQTVTEKFEIVEKLIEGRPVTMETRCCQKKFEFQRYPPKAFCIARYEHKYSKNKFQTFQKRRKKYFLGRSWAKIGLINTQPNVDSKRRDPESSTVIDRQNQQLRHCSPNKR